MDIGRVGSVFARALEPMLLGDDMAFVVTFRDKYDPERLWSAYESMVRENPGLQVILQPSGQSLAWAPIDSSDLEKALDCQRQHFTRTFSFEELLSPVHALTPPLPVRISRLGEREVSFQMSHALSNGRGGVYWIICWIAAANGQSVPPGPTTGRFDSIAPRSGLALLPLYLLNFRARAGRKATDNTVDLTHGKTPIPHKNGYASRTYLFSEAQTSRVLDKARGLDLSLQQYMCLVVAEAMLSAQPEKSRVCILVPTDIARYLPELPRSVPGNYTGTMVVQVRRGAPLESQIARQFRWLRRGVDYWSTRLIAATSPEEGLLKKLTQTAALPFHRRGPFQNVSCAVSNVGVVTAPAEWGVESGYGTTKTQTVFFTIAVLSGCLSANVTFARDLYDPEEVFRVADAALAGLDR